MKETNSILAIYFFLCIVVVFSFYYEFTTLAVVFKMFLVPTIFYYYLLKAIKINWLLLSVLFFCYLGNLMNMFDVFRSNIYLMMIPFFISYILFLMLGIHDVKKLNIQKNHIIPVAIAIIFVLYLYFSILNLLTENYKDFFVPFAIYGFVLVLAAIISPINIILTNRSYDLYYLFVIICFVISDIFYVINNYYFKVAAIQMIDHSLEVLSYFFLIKYIISRENYVEENIFIEE